LKKGFPPGARKKLLVIQTVVVKTPLAQINKSFLLLFFKKEVLSSALRKT
jgi:hypothetical protein